MLFKSYIQVPNLRLVDIDLPKINVKLSLFDQIVEILSVVALLVLMIIPIIYFARCRVSALCRTHHFKQISS